MDIAKLRVLFVGDTSSSDAAFRKVDRQVAGAGAELGGLRGKAREGLGGVGEEAEKAGSRVGGFTGKVKSGMAGVGGSIKHVADQFGGFGVLGAGSLAAVAGESIKMAGDFQASTNVLVTAAGESTANIGKIRQGILDIGTATGTSFDNLTEGIYQIEKAGYRGADALKVEKAAAQGAREENARLADVTNAMTSVMASYHLKASDSVRVMNALKTAAGEGKMTMEELSSSLSTVLPQASAAGLGFDQVAGAVATLTQHGTSAREATQELSNTIRSLEKPNGVAIKTMQQLGLNVTDVSQHLGKRGLTGTLEMLVNAITSHMGPSGLVLLNAFNQSKSAAADANVMISKMPASLQKLAREYQNGSITTKEWHAALKDLSPQQASLASQFATVENRARGFNDMLRSGSPAAQTFTGMLGKVMGGATGMNTALMLTGENMAGFKDRVDKVGKSLHDGGKDVEGWSTTQKQFNTQMASAKQGLHAVAITFGTALLPAATKAMQLFADGAGTLSRHHKAAAALAILIGGGLTTAVVGLGASMLMTAGSAIASFATMTASGIAWAAEQAVSIGESIALYGMYAAEWMATTAAMAVEALAAGVEMALPFLPVILVLAAVGVAAYELYKHWDSVWGFVKRITADVWGFIKRVVHDGIKFVEMLFLNFTGPGLLIKHWGTIKKDAAAVWTWLKDAFHKGVHFIEDLFFKFTPEGILIKHWHQVIAGIKHLWSEITGFFSRGIHDFEDFGKHIIGGLIRGITGMAGELVHAIEHTVTDHLPGFVRKALGINSPSRVFAEIGRYTVQGLQVGIEDQARTLPGTMGRLAAAVTLPRQATGAGLADADTARAYGQSLAGTGAGRTVHVEGSSLSLTVQGNVDRDTLPELERKFRKLLDDRDAQLLTLIQAQ